MKVMVTGTAGFIGNALAIRLLERGDEVLGVDNLVFISILTNKLPEHQRSNARRIGIGLAVILRLGLLTGVAYIVQLTTPLFSVFGHGFSWRDLILIAGGLFLIYKATSEIHDHVSVDYDSEAAGRAVQATAMGVITARHVCAT